MDLNQQSAEDFPKGYIYRWQIWLKNLHKNSEIWKGINFQNGERVGTLKETN